MASFNIKVVPTVVSASIAALLAYALYNYADSESNRWLLTIVGGIMSFVMLFGMMGFTIQAQRSLAMMRVFSSIFFIATLVTNILFCANGFTEPLFIIVNGIVLLIYVLIQYYMAKAAL